MTWNRRQGSSEYSCCPAPGRVMILPIRIDPFGPHLINGQTTRRKTRRTTRRKTRRKQRLGAHHLSKCQQNHNQTTETSTRFKKKNGWLQAAPPGGSGAAPRLPFRLTRWQRLIKQLLVQLPGIYTPGSGRTIGWTIGWTMGWTMGWPQGLAISTAKQPLRSSHLHFPRRVLISISFLPLELC